MDFYNIEQYPIHSEKTSLLKTLINKHNIISTQLIYSNLTAENVHYQQYLYITDQAILIYANYKILSDTCTLTNLNLINNFTNKIPQNLPILWAKILTPSILNQNYNFKIYFQIPKQKFDFLIVEYFSETVPQYDIFENWPKFPNFKTGKILVRTITLPHILGDSDGKVTVLSDENICEDLIIASDSVFYFNTFKTKPDLDDDPTNCSKQANVLVSSNFEKVLDADYIFKFGKVVQVAVLLVEKDKILVKIYNFCSKKIEKIIDIEYNDGIEFGQINGNLGISIISQNKISFTSNILTQPNLTIKNLTLQPKAIFWNSTFNFLTISNPTFGLETFDILGRKIFSNYNNTWYIDESLKTLSSSKVPTRGQYFKTKFSFYNFQMIEIDNIEMNLNVENEKNLILDWIFSLTEIDEYFVALEIVLPKNVLKNFELLHILEKICGFNNQIDDHYANKILKILQIFSNSELQNLKLNLLNIPNEKIQNFIVHKFSTNDRFKYDSAPKFLTYYKEGLETGRIAINSNNANDIKRLISDELR